MKFQTGDIVESKVTAQGMDKGSHYAILNSRSETTAWGTFTWYEVRHTPDDIYIDLNAPLLVIGNGQMILTKIGA
jgi:hypothetical protein